MFYCTCDHCLTGTIYVYSSHIMYVDGHPLPYAINQTISYDPSDGRRLPYLVQRLQADDINVERSISDDSLHYNLTTAVGKGKYHLMVGVLNNRLQDTAY